MTWLKSIIARNRRHLCNREMISVGPAVWKKRALLFVHNQKTTEYTNNDIVRGAESEGEIYHCAQQAAPCNREMISVGNINGSKVAIRVFLIVIFQTGN